MKFKIINADFSQPAAMMAYVIGTLPPGRDESVIRNVKITVADRQLTLQATDETVQLSYTVLLSEVEEGGSCMVGARQLADTVKELDNTSLLDISFTDSSNLTIQASDGSRFKINASEPLNFPTFTQNDEMPQVTRLPQKHLKYFTDMCLPYVFVDAFREYLRGMRLETMPDGTFQAVGCDGHRLALAKARLTEMPANPLGLLITRRMTEVMGRILDDKSEAPVELRCNEGKCMVSANGYVLVGRLLTCPYPMIDSIIPREFACSALLNRQELVQRLKMVAVMTVDRIYCVQMSFKPGELLLMAENTKHETGKATCSMEYEGEPFDIAFNVNYLVDALSRARTEKVRFAFDQDMKSATLMPVLDGGNDEEVSVRFIISKIVL